MIQIEKLNFTVSNTVGGFALKDVCLHIRPGEYFVLLGPTGSGKTLLVECLCGLNRIDSGRVRIDGVDVTRLEPRRRGIGYLPQDYALFPLKTVRQNFGFGLQNRRQPRASVRQKIDRLMEQLGVAHLADRLPRKLSGGEKQRVALGRALAIRPRVLVLDEPVSALDEQTCDGLCRLLKQLQQAAQTTAVHICHNFAEMLTVADRVGIIDEGRILQVGTPQEILQRPCSTRVARFVRAGNLFSTRIQGDGQWVRLTCAGGMELCAPRPKSESLAGEVSAMVRPENIHLDPARPDHLPPGTTVLEGSIGEVVDFGSVVAVRVVCGSGVEVLVSLGKKEYHGRHVGIGDHVHLAIAPEDVHLMKQ